MTTVQIQQSVVVTQNYPDDPSYLYAVAYYTNPENGVTLDSQDPVSRTIVFHRDDTPDMSY